MKKENLFIVLGIGLAGFFLWLLLRSKTAKGQQVTSKIQSFQPTQLGAPASAIAALTYEQLQNDVAFWIDPATGTLIPNTNGLLDGRVPMVALTDQNQVSNWFQQNPQAVIDIDQGGSNAITG